MLGCNPLNVHHFAELAGLSFGWLLAIEPLDEMGVHGVAVRKHVNSLVDRQFDGLLWFHFLGLGDLGDYLDTRKYILVGIFLLLGIISSLSLLEIGRIYPFPQPLYGD